jgi:hypothetical protein
MEHTKKFVLVDPRFVRPTMRDKVLSGLDTDISNILNSDDTDEIKAKNYITALARFRNYSVPPRSEEIKPLPPPPLTAVPAVPSVPFKAVSPRKRSHKRVKVELPVVDPPLDATLWRRTQRQQTKKKFGSQWTDYNTRSKKKKSHPSWIEL